MPRAVSVASGTADVQAVTGTSTVVGFSVRENAGTAAVATVVIRNGTSSASPAVALIELAGDESHTTKIPAVDCPAGIFVDRVAGETEIVIYVL